MSIKCSVYVGASVDGFIARPDGDVEWLDRYAGSTIPGLGYEAFIATVDGLVMGRHSFEKVLSFGSWPYEGVPVTVLSTRELDVPDHLAGKVDVASGSPERIVSRLEAEGKRHLYIDGGNTIQGFLAAGLIHEITITRVPVLLGSGIPLFGSGGPERPLRLIEAAASEDGIVQERYEVRRAA